MRHDVRSLRFDASTRAFQDHALRYRRAIEAADRRWERGLEVDERELDGAREALLRHVQRTLTRPMGQRQRPSIPSAARRSEKLLDSPSAT